MKDNTLETLNLIAQIIYDKKGSNILALDIQGLASLADYVVIAEGNVDRHVAAIARAIIDELHERGIDPVHVEGLKTGDWVALDYSTIRIRTADQHPLAAYARACRPPAALDRRGVSCFNFWRAHPQKTNVKGAAQVSDDFIGWNDLVFCRRRTDGNVTSAFCRQGGKF